jgi:2-polyprenyl-6-methoxyphenol hydroxylase-like FAD-dependent oxidoreductase
MPFQAEPTLTMWQLSFAEPSEEEAVRLKALAPADLMVEAMRMTSGWFAMVSEMIAATDTKEVWCTALYDRPTMLQRSRDDKSRVVVLGDACHPMSMFKGQGANQAIGDGPLLASWLCRTGLNYKNISTRLKCFEQEMVSKTAPKVKASRQAALHLHSAACFEEKMSIEGVDPAMSESVLCRLREEKVGALSGGSLDSEVEAVIKSLRP